ncbi:MAG: S8 family serine peptidase [Xenococcaceae cyanobacterium MO_188.B29]|nr:S8 family serine peptidase [Xenococcaceae cyanobacterium MO_188.B29]
MTTMNEAHLRYGNSSLDLIKDQKMIALKPKSGNKQRLMSAIKSSVPGSQESELGEFVLVDVENIPETIDLENTLDTIRLNPSVDVGTHVFNTPSSREPFIPTGELYVVFADNVNQQSCEQLIDELHLEFVKVKGEREFVVKVTNESANPIKTAVALQQSPLVSVAEPDLATPSALYTFAIPTDELLTDQWHLQNTGFHGGTSLGFLAGADARVIEAWSKAQTVGEPQVIVAVIDDGFDLNHPDLSGDGKIVAPKDFTRNSNDPSPALGDWHGTACAGVAVGSANNNGIVGAAPNCSLMPVRWGTLLTDNQVEDWFDHVLLQGAWVVSCSWGAANPFFPLSTRKFNAIRRCAQQGRNGLGCVICFAAGNSNRDINNPPNSLDGFAIHPDVIAVAASNSRDQKANYSNFGDEISVCAPSSGAGGWAITTSDVTGTYVDQFGQVREAGYGFGAYTNAFDDSGFGGTSSACPLVAGICALLLSIKPDLTAAEVKDLLEKTARKIGDPSTYDANGHSPFFGYGCVDAAAAVDKLLADS